MNDGTHSTVTLARAARCTGARYSVGSILWSLRPDTHSITDTHSIRRLHNTSLEQEQLGEQQAAEQRSAIISTVAPPPVVRVMVVVVGVVAIQVLMSCVPDAVPAGSSDSPLSLNGRYGRAWKHAATLHWARHRNGT